MHKPYHPHVGPAHVDGCFGVYLGKISRTRPHDVWVKVQVPQVFGSETESDWARPMGFDSYGVSTADLPWELNDGNHTHGDPQGGEVSEPIPNDELDLHTSQKIRLPDGTWHPNRIAGYTGERRPIPSGPGPGPGTIVLVMFIGGDKRLPAYMLTTQNVKGYRT